MRHPLIERMRNWLDHLRGERLLTPGEVREFYTDQMPMAPPYRGPDPGRAPPYDVHALVEVDDRTTDSSSSAEPPKND